jgi:iron complex outermembrane receptor protein
MRKFAVKNLGKVEMTTVFHKALLAAGCLALLPASTVFAQSATGNVSVLEEIVVTAQKRQENMQDVPIAVTAISGDALQKVGVTDTFDLKALVPSLNFSTAVGGIGLPRIRGVGSTGFGPGVENPVATYIDGVYISSSIGALTSLNDIAQVAVLKGPQGTLFGRNATGGLIQITTKQPSHDFKGDVQATVGNYGTAGGGLYLTGGMSDSIAASIAFKYEDRNDGYGVNTKTGNDILTQQSYSGRAKVLWEVDATSATLSADMSHVDSANAAFRPVTRNVRGNFAAGGQRDTDADIDPSMDADQTGASLEIRHQFGGMELMSLSAYRNMELNTKFDPDGTTEDEWVGVPFANAVPSAANGFQGQGFNHGFVIENTAIEKQFTQEIQLQSTGEGSFKWVMGAFYMKGDGKYDPARSTNAFQTAGNAAFGAPPGRYTDLVATQTLDSYAAFVQGSYALGAATNLTAGLRYTRDEREASGIRQTYEATGRLVAVQTAPQGVVESSSDTFSEPTWRLSLDHRFSPEVMGYASYNRGFRSAAFVVQNIGLTTPLTNKLLQPEIVDAYEVGIKTDLLDRRVRLNAAAYYYDQKNAQVMQIQSGIQFIYNAEGAKIYGLDADLTALVTEHFTLTAGVNYTHGRYTQFTNAVAAIPQAAGGNLLTIGDASGKRLQNVPDWTANLGASYDVPTSVGDITFSGNYYHNDGWAADPDNRVNQEAYGLLDGSVSWQSSNEKLSLSLWGKNLTDEFYFQQLGASNFADNGVQAAPRTYGVTFGLHF